MVASRQEATCTNVEKLAYRFCRSGPITGQKHGVHEYVPTMSSVYDLIVIGSGPAGQRAAIYASKLGKKVAMVAMRQVVGGA